MCADRNPTPATLEELVAAHDIRFVLATFVDLNGKPCAKLVPAQAVDRLVADGVGFAGFAAGAMGQTPADPDLIAKPDVSSFVPMHFVRPGLAMVQCDIEVDGQPWPFSSRLILRAVLDRVAAAGFTAKVGAEAEYFLVSRSADGTLTTADPQDRSLQPCYDARDLTRMYDHLTAVSTALNELGWDNYANDHEDGNGQFEQNFTHDDPMVTADRVIAFRYLLHALAEQRGMTATFMPKPFADRTGTGLHLHMSLWRDGEPAFPAYDDERGFGLSPVGYGFIAGVLAHAPGLMGVLGPTVNSYKRTGASTTSSGATWAPRSATYGGNDRTHLIRIPDGHRVEIRVVDGGANPYLALAGLLAAGLEGVVSEADPGTPGSGAASSAPLPPTLLHAADALAADPLVVGALDAADPMARVAAYYCNRKRDEFIDYHAVVTPWEIDHYLTLT